MNKQLKFSQAARAEMAKGIECLLNATKVTLGPRGRNVIIEQDFSNPLIVNDGVTIAKSIKLIDNFQNMGSAIIIEAASKTNDVVGDGTTTAILLAATIILEGIKAIDAGINPVLLQKGFQYFLPLVLAKIDEMSTPIESLNDLENIASISSGSEEIGALIKKAYLEVGTDGVVAVDESKSIETFLNVVKGYAYERGFLSPYMTNQQDKQIAILEKPLILIMDKKISSMSEILIFLEEAVKLNRSVLIICEDMEQEVLNALIINKLRGVFQVVVTKVPGFGDKKTQLLGDLAIITGAKYLDDNTARAVDLNLDVLGTCQKAIITKDQTTIIDGSGSSDAINEHAKTLKDELKKTSSEYEKEKLTERIAKILSGIAMINVGAPTETELKDKKLRIEDALNATRAAYDSGIIEGGGKVLYEISELLSSMPVKKEYIHASNILAIAFKEPFKQILINAGEDVNYVLTKVNDKIWYDANTGDYVSLIEKGIIDPTSVLKSALINAVSIASAFITTECAIVNAEEKNNDSEDPLR